MRKAAEAADDVAMTKRVRQVRLAQATHQIDLALLVVEVLGMAERQIEELRQLAIDSSIMPGLDGSICNESRMTVGCVHACRAAERIARELIQEDDERQCAVGNARPSSQLATRRSDFAATVASGGAPALVKKLDEISDKLMKSKGRSADR